MTTTRKIPSELRFIAVEDEALSPVDLVVRYLRANDARYTVRSLADRSALEPDELEDSTGPLVQSTLVRVNDKRYLCVSPAATLLDLPLLNVELRAWRTEVVPVDEARDLCQGFELAHLPPFGQLLHHEVLLCPRLAHRPQLSFCLRPFAEVVTVATDDYLRLSQAHIVPMTRTL
jgi:hypothetical protein